MKITKGDRVRCYQTGKTDDLVSRIGCDLCGHGDNIMMCTKRSGNKVGMSPIDCKYCTNSMEWWAHEDDVQRLFNGDIWLNWFRLWNTDKGVIYDTEGSNTYMV